MPPLEIRCRERDPTFPLELVAVNQGADAADLTMQPCGLPDDDYRCLLGGQPLKVEGGCLPGLKLDSHVAVLQGNGYPTQLGQWLAITGSCPAFPLLTATVALPRLVDGDRNRL